MTPLIAALAAGLILAGLVLFVFGVRKTPPPAPRPPRRGLTTAARSARLSRRTKILAAAGLAAGLLLALLTGWVIALIVLPVAAAGLPALFTAPEAARRIRRLEAMAEWTRALAGVLTVGVGLEEALVATLRSTPQPIRPEVATLAARLRSRWTTRAAVTAFANDLDDYTGDLIAAALLLGAEQRGPGLASVLEGLAESVAADVDARREIETERAKLRFSAQAVTVVVVVVLTIFALTGSYIAPLGTPLGQLISLTLFAAYLATLVWLKRMAQGQPLPRFLGTGDRNVRAQL